MIIIGKVIGINTSDNMYNISVEDKDKNVLNLKILQSEEIIPKINETYEFDCEVITKDRVSYNILSMTNAKEFDYKKKSDTLRTFYNASPISREDSEKEINKYLNMIENKIIKDITVDILNKYHDDFYIYPAATRMHHAYIGGLSHHTIGMLHLALSMIENYPYLNKDYLISAIILHDITKTKELTEEVFPQYSADGQLLGHLVMGAMEINLSAKKLGYENSKEAMVLEHMIISHHGIPQFGACKKPLIAEALMLWYIDSIDSKFRTLEHELSETEVDEFTQSIGVLEKTKFYKI
ncbi:MAG: HD domain-containing protein [Acholeplasmatales bacterium]|nr:HD domain-containing protein [Acholeplasmatales bacterium]